MNPVLLLLADGFEEIEAITTLDILRRAQIPVITAAPGNSRQITGGHQLSVMADSLLADVINQEFSLIVLPGGGKGVENLAASSAVAGLLTQKSQVPVGAICAAPGILAGLNLVKGKNLTSYPSAEKTLIAAGAHYHKDSVVKDGNLVTSRGPGTTIEFALALVEMLRGREIASRVAEQILWSKQI